MGTGTATLPASMISYANGIDIQKRLAQNPSLTATLTFTLGEVIASTDGLVSGQTYTVTVFSSKISPQSATFVAR